MAKLPASARARPHGAAVRAFPVGHGSDARSMNTSDQTSGSATPQRRSCGVIMAARRCRLLLHRFEGDDQVDVISDRSLKALDAPVAALQIYLCFPAGAVFAGLEARAFAGFEDDEGDGLGDPVHVEITGELVAVV